MTSFISIPNLSAIVSSAIPFCASECVISIFPLEDDDIANSEIQLKFY